MSNCNACVKVNPLPECIDSEVFLLLGLTFVGYEDSTIVAVLEDLATEKSYYFDVEIDEDGNVVSFDIASAYPLFADHPYKIRFITQSSGSPANFTLTNEDTSTATGCCVEFSINELQVGSDSFFLSNLGCAADDPSGTGSGSLFMLKSVYDPDGDGCVECADTVGGYTAPELLDRANHEGVQAISTITGLQTELDAKQTISNLGVTYAPLLGGVVPLINLPAGTPNQYLGLYDASTNTPAILNGTGTAGEFYIASVVGNAYVPVNVTLVNQIVVYSGTVWEVGPVFTGGIAQITTDAGVQVGPSPTINTTAHMAPVGDRQYANEDQKDAMDNANAPTSLNPFATQADLTAIVVGSSFFMPELFSNGETLGNGTLRTLNSLGYTNPEAATLWPKVTADPRIGYDVTTASIDWIAWQEACLTMEQEGYNKITNTGDKGYCFDQSCLLPRDQVAVNFYRRSLQFTFDFASSTFANRTGGSMICFDKYPEDQTDANGLRLSYSYFFEKGKYYGNDSGDSADCFIRIGGTKSTKFRDLEISEMGIGIDAQFCLQVGFDNINLGGYGLYGLAARDGLWLGAGANISQSNNATFNECHHSHSTGKVAEAGIYCQGNRNIKIDTCQFEGQNGATRHIFYEQNTPGSPTLDVLTVKNTIEMTNLDFEAAGASRAGIHVLGNNISAFLEKYQTQVPPADMANLYEAECFNAINGRITSFIRYSNNSNPGYKFCNNNFGSTQAWVIEYVELNNAAVLNSANWDTVTGTIPLVGAVNFTPII